MTGKIRAFLSVDIEDNVLLSEITRIQAKIDKGSMKFKSIEQKNIHFTLHFFGDIELQMVDTIYDALSNIQLGRFPIHIAGVGAFPNPHRPRVIWVGVTQGENEFNQLQAKIEIELKRIGYKADKKFHAHVTIARVREVRNRDAAIRNLETLIEDSVGSMTVSSFRMTKSTLTPSGPIYETVWEIPLH